MNEFYDKIKDVNFKGAIFFAVCRGKVSFTSSFLFLIKTLSIIINFRFWIVCFRIIFWVVSTLSQFRFHLRNRNETGFKKSVSTLLVLFNDSTKMVDPSVNKEPKHTIRIWCGAMIKNRFTKYEQIIIRTRLLIFFLFYRL